MKVSKSERKEAIDRLRDWIKPGSTVFTTLRHVSRSGMMRHIDLHIIEDNEPRWISGMVARATDTRTTEQGALKVGGCGMDMGFALVYELSQTLYGSRLVPDVYQEGHDEQNEITRDGAPQGYVYSGGYKCLGKGKCPSNYHTNHRERIRCEGTRVHNPDGPDHGSFCYAPSSWRGEDIPEGWPHLTIDVGDGATIQGPPLHCVGDDDKREVCPTCKGEGSLPNPEGPERFDLVHTDGYAIKHRWM